MQLIYRGQAFNYSPATLSAAVVAKGLTRTLLYRGDSYRYQFAALQPTRLPKAINWRFAGVSDGQYQSLRPAH
ncbi:MAG: DUF4278 domain-containing protein [Leptolyngbya sp. BL-A-14]